MTIARKIVSGVEEDEQVPVQMANVKPPYRILIVVR